MLTGAWRCFVWTVLAVSVCINPYTPRPALSWEAGEYQASGTTVTSTPRWRFSSDDTPPSRSSTSMWGETPMRSSVGPTGSTYRPVSRKIMFGGWRDTPACVENAGCFWQLELYCQQIDEPDLLIPSAWNNRTQKSIAKTQVSKQSSETFFGHQHTDVRVVHVCPAPVGWWSSPGFVSPCRPWSPSWRCARGTWLSLELPLATTSSTWACSSLCPLSWPWPPPRCPTACPTDSSTSASPSRSWRYARRFSNWFHSLMYLLVYFRDIAH